MLLHLCIEVKLKRSFSPSTEFFTRDPPELMSQIMIQVHIMDVSLGQWDDCRNLWVTYNFITHMNPPLMGPTFTKLFPRYLFSISINFAHWSRGPLLVPFFQFFFNTGGLSVYSIPYPEITIFNVRFVKYSHSFTRFVMRNCPEIFFIS